MCHIYNIYIWYIYPCFLRVPLQHNVRHRYRLDNIECCSIIDITIGIQLTSSWSIRYRPTCELELAEAICFAGDRPVYGSMDKLWYKWKRTTLLNHLPYPLSMTIQLINKYCFGSAVELSGFGSGSGSWLRNHKLILDSPHQDIKKHLLFYHIRKSRGVREQVRWQVRNK